jgi:phospholipid/cholesterol/gamma-HCH transport system substrate-binding protein
MWPATLDARPIVSDSAHGAESSTGHRWIQAADRKFSRPPALGLPGREQESLRGTAPLARIAALAALIAAAAFIAVTLLRGAGESYEVNARFENASQLVKGNLVQVSGMPAGKVEEIRLTDDGQAELTLSIDDRYAPLRRGTHATVRQASVSGVANRYVELRLPGGHAPAIPDGGTLTQESTTTAVDLDEIFNTLDEPTREDIQKVLKGSDAQHAGRGAQMNAGLLYLNPNLSSTSRLFRELNADSKLLERFVVASSQLVTDLADRREDLAGLVDHLATTTNAIGSEQEALAESIQRLPDFMRRANTTFLNLRAALDDLEPLVDDSKPVAKKLRPFLAQLRPLAQDARPTVRDLSRLLRAPGKGNDVIDLTNGQPPLRDIAVGEVDENGESRPGAFPASSKALEDVTPQIGYLRPYTVDLLGWFDDFSHSGTYDALGAASRVGIHASAFALLEGQLTPVPPGLRDEVFQRLAATDQRNRCPGGGDHRSPDGSRPWKPTPDYNCDPSQVLPGG